MKTAVKWTSTVSTDVDVNQKNKTTIYVWVWMCVAWESVLGKLFLSVWTKCTFALTPPNQYPLELHDTTAQVLMPKVSQKLKILKKSFIISKFKTAFFVFCQC